MDAVLHRLLIWGAEIPEPLRRTCRDTEALLPEFEVRLWRNDDVRALLAERAPDYLRVYDGYARDIQRADFARYAILYFCGGLYLDLDVEALRPGRPLFSGPWAHSCLLCEETRLTPEFRAATASYPIRQSLPENERPECTLRIANYLLAAATGDRTMERILDLCVARSGLTVREDYDVIFTTGPDVVSTVVDSHEDESRRVIPLEEAGQFFRHQAAGSWRTDARAATQ